MDRLQASWSGGYAEGVVTVEDMPGGLLRAALTIVPSPDRSSDCGRYVALVDVAEDRGLDLAVPDDAGDSYALLSAT